MAQRSSLLELPDDLRKQLNARLVAKGFSNYDGFAQWLNNELETRGLELRVSRSAIHRHGQKFEDKLETLRVATEQAKAISEGAEDDEGTMNDALIRLIQTKTFETLRDMEDGQPIHKIGLMVARLVRASVNQKKWSTEYREKLNAKKQEAATKVEALTKKSGLSKDVATQIRAEILGINVSG